jgi:hypothetical protein
MGGVLDHDSDTLVPGVAVEDAPDELAVLRNLVPGVGGAVDADEPAAALDEAEQRARRTSGRRGRLPVVKNRTARTLARESTVRRWRSSRE